MSNQCDICCENYNLSLHAKVTCEHTDCSFAACKTCVRTYLLGTTGDPSCMNCKKAWSDQFLVSNLNRAFCEKDYKKHRKGLLLERELSKLPETMILAERERKTDKEEAKLTVLNKQITALNAQLRTLQMASRTIHENVRYIKEGGNTDGKSPEAERRKFIMACPNETCRGYLSTQYKCELCETYTCPHCLELIGYSKTDPHTCDPNNVASAELIKKDTKPCPQCGVRIHKISGCDQMWCTECRVAFSYKTLKIDTGVTVHNPHYYAYMRQQNNGLAARNPQDVVCGGLITLTRVHRLILPPLKTCLDDIEYATMVTYIDDIHRSIAHMSYHDLPRLRTDLRTHEDHGDLRVRFILNKITREDMTNTLYKRDIKRKKTVELLHLYELLNVVGIETFNALETEGLEFARKFVKEPLGLLGRRAPPPTAVALQAHKTKHMESVNEKILALDNLREYCNKRFAKISVTYNNTVTHITDMWQIRSKKYRITEVK
jgi:hypothetical protein